MEKQISVSDIWFGILFVQDRIPWGVPREKSIGDIGAGWDNSERVCLGVSKRRFRENTGEAEAALAGWNVGVENIHGGAAVFQLVLQISLLVLRLKPLRPLVPYDLWCFRRSSSPTSTANSRRHLSNPTTATWPGVQGLGGSKPTSYQIFIRVLGSWLWLY